MTMKKKRSIDMVMIWRFGDENVCMRWKDIKKIGDFVYIA